MMTLCPRAERCSEVGHPQNPSPPKTIIFIPDFRNCGLTAFGGTLFSNVLGGGSERTSQRPD